MKAGKRCKKCGILKVMGKDLIFLHRIKADGSGTIVFDSPEELWQDEVFKVNSLSVTNETYIASGFNSFVVKLKS